MQEQKPTAAEPGPHEHSECFGPTVHKKGALNEPRKICKLSTEKTRIHTTSDYDQPQKNSDTF